MTAITDGVRVTATIGPTDTTDTYATIDPIYGIDGWRGVASAAERNAISTARRREGMIAYQQDLDQLWQLNAAPWVGTDADWTLRSFGGAPAAPNTSVQFNDAGVFGGDAGFTFDKATGILTAPAVVIGNTGISFDVLATAAIAVNTNDFALAGRNSLRIDCTVASNLTGIDSVAFASISFPLFLYNSGSAVLTLKNQDAGSLPGNRFLLDADLALTPNNGVVLMYDPTSLRWRLVGKTVSSGTEARKITTITAAGTTALTAADCQIEIDATLGNITITIPTAASVADGTNGRVYYLKRVDTSANSVTVNRSGGDTFITTTPGNTSFTMATGDQLNLCGNPALARWSVG
jgi:hypothetical protein